MVNAGKSHVQHFQVGRSFHHLGGIGIVGDDGDVAIPRPADEFWYDEAKTAAVIPYMLAVHYGPGMDWGENMALNMGDTVEILAKQNGWVLLRTADGRYGWAAGELLRETADAPAATATPAAPVNPADPAVPVAPATAAPMAAPTPDYTEVSNPDLQ